VLTLSLSIVWFAYVCCSALVLVERLCS